MRAFTLLEVVGLIAVLSILAAAAVPSLVAYLTRRNVERTATILSDLGTGLTAFHAQVSEWPFRISHLGGPVFSTDTTSCSGVSGATPVTVYGGDAARWGTADGGPFFHRAIPVTGFPTPIGTIIDSVFRPFNNHETGPLNLIIRSASFEDAEELNSYVDGDADNGDRSNSLGKVQWAAPVSELVDLYYAAVAATGKVC